jgi:hypothetical protein
MGQIWRFFSETGENSERFLFNTERSRVCGIKAEGLNKRKGGKELVG